MNVIEIISLSTCLDIIMRALSFRLFRFSLRKHVGSVFFSALLTSNCIYLCNYVLDLAYIAPLITLLIHTLILTLLLQVTKMQAFIMAFMSMLLYLLVMAFMAFLIHQVEHVSYDIILNDSIYGSISKIMTLIGCTIIFFLLRHYRLGFTLVGSNDTNSAKQIVGQPHVYILVVAVLIFSLAYYAVKVNILYLLWVIVSFGISLAGLTYYLYNKEMKEE